MNPGTDIRPTLKHRLHRWLPLFVITVGISTGVGYWAFTHGLTDMLVYTGAAESWWHGRGLYSFELKDRGLRFTYPPFAVLVFLPFAVLPHGAAALLITLLGIASAGYLVRVCRGRRDPGPVFAVGLVFVLLAAPGRENLWLGQVNILLAALVVLDLWTFRDRRWSGVLLGLAIGVKLTPAVFLFLLLITRRWRTAAIASATFAGTVVIGALATGREAWTFFTRLLWDTDRVGGVSFVSNQSPKGVIARLMDPAPAGLATVVSGLLFLAVMFMVWRSRDQGLTLPAILTTGIAGLLLSPISWTHHWVWPSLLIIALVPGSPYRKPPHRTALSCCAAILAIGPMWFYPNPDDTPLTPGLIPALATSALTVVALALPLLIPRPTGTDATPARIPADKPSGTAGAQQCPQVG